MLLGALQENLLVLLCFDKERAPIIRNTIEVNLFGGQYRQIVVRVYDYIDKYKKPPGDHLADILDDKLHAENKREADLYKDVVSSIYEAQPGINAEYVMTQLGVFGRRQALRTIAVDLAKALQRDTEASLEEADVLIRKAQNSPLNLFDPGLRLGDKTRSLNFLDIAQSSFPTGIAELDRRGFGPTRKELFLAIANTKGGKTWFLIHLAKIALMHRLKVCHVTLEMSEDRAAQRYFQALFSISKRKERFQTTRFKRDSLDRITALESVELRPALSLDDDNIRGKLERRVEKWGNRMLNNIVIKQFPTGTLTINQLTAYLDNLELQEHFVPDLLLIDYPDLMRLDKANLRLSIDELYKDLRGVGVARNLAVAAVSQSHRGAARAKTVEADNVAEAYSKIAHADVAITISQTKAEEQLGLARLFVAAGRNDKDRLTLAISQNFGTGQFIVDSAPLRGNYWNLLPKPEDAEDE